jgi:ABC-type nitrate/sulfonate/bicarbonate transport system substrate-binding protein
MTPRLWLCALLLSVGLACGPTGTSTPTGTGAAQPPSGASGPAPSGAGASTAAGSPVGGSPAASADNPYLAQPGQPLQTIRVATCAVSGGFVHLYTAMEANLFEKYGFRVEHTNISGSAPALTALTTNEIQFLYCAADATLAGLASGFEVKLVADPLLGIPYVMIARPEVHSVADLRGKSIGVARAGDLSDRLSRLTVEKFGMRPNEDVQIRPIGGSQPERYQALLGGVTQAIAITPPLEVQARKDGLNLIYDLTELGLPFVYSSVHASNNMIRDNPQLIQRFVAAIGETLHFTEKNPEVARQALRKVLNLEDPESLDSAYNAYALKIINRRMSIPFDVLTAGIEDAREQGTQVTVRSGADVATNQFVDELDRSGFLQKLWGAELPPK